MVWVRKPRGNNNFPYRYKYLISLYFTKALIPIEREGMQLIQRRNNNCYYL